jgi:molybdate transport system permease protein
MAATIAMPQRLRADPGGADAPQREPIVVLAASSLADSLPAIGDDWHGDGQLGQQDHQQATRRPFAFSFAGSSRLARQILAGAPGDVYVSANPQWMQRLADQGAVLEDSRRQFLSNDLVWVVPPKSARNTADPLPTSAAEIDPTRIEYLALAGQSVPAGIYADQALQHHGLASAFEGRVVRSDHVRAALEWVARGEVDAGVVYRTDARAEPGVEIAFAFEPTAHQPITYEAGVLATSEHPEAAADFVDSLSAPHARSVFEQAGFSAPEPIAAEASSVPDKTRVDVWSAIRLSLLVGLWCALLGLFPAIGLGWLLARREFRGKSLVSTVVLAPLALPPVVTGFLLLRVFGSQGLVGGFLAKLGLKIPFSMLGAVLAAFVVGLPMYVLSARHAFEAVDAQLEEVSLTMGHPPWKTFLRVTLPLAAPGLAAGAVLMFARAIGEFGATTVLAGNFEGETRTISLAVYTLLESPNGGQAIGVLVVASLVLSFLAMLGYERLSRWQRGRPGVRDDG